VARSDLVYLHGHHVFPASELALRLKEPLTWYDLQDYFARNFLGVALEASPIGEVAAIAVATAGVFQFDGHPNVAQLGAWVAPELSDCGQVLHAQRIQYATRPARGIGKIARLSLGETTEFEVMIFSRVFRP
jgi:hypothetical protein